MTVRSVPIKIAESDGGLWFDAYDIIADIRSESDLHNELVLTEMEAGETNAAVIHAICAEKMRMFADGLDIVLIEAMNEPDFFKDVKADG